MQRLRTLLPKAVYEVLELAYSVVAYARLARAAREFKPDAVYERYNLYLLAGVMLKRRTGIPLLLEVNAPLARERAEFGGLGLPKLARWAERVAWRGADFVLPVTRVLANEVESQGVDAARIAVIANGINVAQFAAARQPPMRSGRWAGPTRWCSASPASFAIGTVSIGCCTGWLRARRRRTRASRGR